MQLQDDPLQVPEGGAHVCFDNDDVGGASANQHDYAIDNDLNQRFMDFSVADHSRVNQRQASG